MQRPLPDGSLTIVARGVRKDDPLAGSKLLPTVKPPAQGDLMGHWEQIGRDNAVGRERRAKSPRWRRLLYRYGNIGIIATTPAI